MIILSWIVGSVVVSLVASARGRSGVGFFFLSLLLSPVIGLVLALALPSKVLRSEGGEPITAATHVRCPDCREFVRRDAVRCKHCGVALEPEPYVPFSEISTKPAVKGASRDVGMNIVQADGGKWKVGSLEFTSSEAAELYLASRRV